MTIPLELTGLTKVFETPAGPFVAVKDVNARVDVGEFVALLGFASFLGKPQSSRPPAIGASSSRYIEWT